MLHCVRLLLTDNLISTNLMMRPGPPPDDCRVVRRDLRIGSPLRTNSNWRETKTSYQGGPQIGDIRAVWGISK
jgi:hypothetical protein